MLQHCQGIHFIFFHNTEGKMCTECKYCDVFISTELIKRAEEPSADDIRGYVIVMNMGGMFISKPITLHALDMCCFSMSVMPKDSEVFKHSLNDHV